MSTADDVRMPLDPTRVGSLLDSGGSRWPLPSIATSTGSTNDDIAALAAAGAPEGTCVVAEEQVAGRGRQGREWVSPIGGGLWLSVLVRPGGVPKDRWGWLSLMAGLAAQDAVRSACRVPALLKWPNDVVVQAAACGGDKSQRKLGGILSQVIDDDAVAIGIGINVSLRSAELPVPQATSILMEAGVQDREALLADLLVALSQRLAQWRTGDARLAADYREACITIGRLVEVTMPDRSMLSGIVTGIDDDGHLKVDDGESVTTVTAGDVVHATI